MPSKARSSVPRGAIAACTAMVYCLALPAGVGPAWAGTLGAVARRASSAASTWGKALEVPGTAALNTRGNAGVVSVSCSVAANCSAGGFYAGKSGRQAFVVSQVNGRWGKAAEVPGIATLNTGRSAEISSVSCASPGNCAAGGSYTDRAGHQQAFVVSQVNAIWGKAREVPDTGFLNAGGNARVVAVSCGSAGNCTAAGNYTDSSGNGQVFVASQVKGSWRRAVQLPGSPVLSGGGFVDVSSLSCKSPGNCAAGGSYSGGQAFVASQVNGKWVTAKAVPGLAALNTADSAGVISVSCASQGNCAAGGFYVQNIGRGQWQPFVVDEVNGTWGTAQHLLGVADDQFFSEVSSVSCTSPGNCSADGSYGGGGVNVEVFVASEVHGTWGAAAELPGIAALNTGGGASAEMVLSCSSPGNCGGGGGAGASQAFVDNQLSGVWGTARVAPGTKTLNTGNEAAIASVSCPSRGNCSAGGSYTNALTGAQAFVVGYAVKATVTGLTPSSGPARGGNTVTVHGTRFQYATRVWFGSRLGTHLRIINARELKVTAPAGKGTVNVAVTNPGGTSAFTGQDLYRYVLRPTVTGLKPSTGPARGGTIVTVFGTRFTDVTKVRFGTKPGTHVRVINAREIKVTAPSGTGTVNVRVTTPGGTSVVSRKDRYRYR